MTSVKSRCRGDEVSFTRGPHTLVQNANEDEQCVYSVFVCVRCALRHRVCRTYEHSLTCTKSLQKRYSFPSNTIYHIRHKNDEVMFCIQ